MQLTAPEFSVNGSTTTYTKRNRDQISVGNADTSCTSGIVDMSDLFRVGTSGTITFGGTNTFNADISHWDTSSVTDMNNMFAQMHQLLIKLSATGILVVLPI